MNNTWVKLYRKINMNSIMSDRTALQLFVWVLTNVDKDNGEVEFGRFYVAKQLKVNPNTLYSALKRLVSKYKVCKISSTAEYTTITLLNWAKYQPTKSDINTSVNNPSTTKQQPINTLQEERIENRDIYKREYLSNIPLDDVTEFIGKFNCTQSQVRAKGEALLNWSKANGKFKKDYKAFLRNALEKDYGVKTLSGIVNGADYVAIKEKELEAEGNLSFRPDYSKIGRMS